jgi:hypothetical protein
MATIAEAGHAKPLPPSNRGGQAMRLLLLMHRYLGVVMGLLMTLWCLSGFVMMYRGYPQLSEAARLRGLQSLRLAAEPAPLSIGGGERIADFQIETQNDHPVLRLLSKSGGWRSVDLRTGAPAPASLGPEEALTIAKTYATGNGLAGAPRDLGVIGEDQWTVEDAKRNGPVHHIRFDDPPATEIYIADRTGAVVQATTRAARVWGWLGAVPHWLYPTALRRNGVLWANVVIWTSLAGSCLTVTGLYVGVARFKRYSSGRWSPYRGWFFWHHITGLVFGLLTLTWVASGLMTMNPWGLFDTPVETVQHRVLAGEVTGEALKAFLAKAPLNSDFVRLKAAPLGGRLFVIATGRDGQAVRLGEDARPAPLAMAEVAAAIRSTNPLRIVALSPLSTEDDCYYSGYDGAVRLPVYRARLAGPAATTLYIDAVSGQVVRAIDRTARTSRWLRTGLHDWDFAGLRRRPIWDAVVLSLLLGVTAVCALGAWLGLLRVRRDWAGWRSHT